MVGNKQFFMPREEVQDALSNILNNTLLYLHMNYYNSLTVRNLVYQLETSFKYEKIQLKRAEKILEPRIHGG